MSAGLRIVLGVNWLSHSWRFLARPFVSLCLPATGSVFYIVIPIVVVVIILKLCLIFWRVWLYSKVSSTTHSCPSIHSPG